MYRIYGMLLSIFGLLVGFRCLCVHSVVSYATLHCVGLERTVFYFMHLFRHTLPSSVGGCKSSNVCMYSIAQYSSLNKFEEL